jgi:uncharacterized protein YdhG (YjbR/CyaY superfamily)
LNKDTPSTVDEYIAAASPEQRAVLKQLRSAVRAAAPDAEEVIAYKMPSYKYHGWLVHIGAAQTHCSLYGVGQALQGKYAEELKSYFKSKGTIRFPLDMPVPIELVKTLVRECMAQADERVATRRRTR